MIAGCEKRLRVFKHKRFDLSMFKALSKEKALCFFAFLYFLCYNKFSFHQGLSSPVLQQKGL